MHYNQVNPTAPQYDDYDDEYDDEETYDEDDEEENEAVTKGKTVDTATAGVATPGHQQETRAKLDSYQFEIVAQSIRRFDKYLEFTRGRDSEYAKNKNLRRDDFSEDEFEDRSPRGSGRFLDTRSPRQDPRRGPGPSPAPPGYLAPNSGRGENLHREPTAERRERPRGDRRTPEPDEFEQDYVEETTINRRRRGGAFEGNAPRSRQRAYEDDYGYSGQGRYR